MKIGKEVKIGVLLVTSIALLFWGLNYLKGNDIFSKSRKFYAIYPRVDGLGVSNPVIINGFQVGKVDNIYLHPSNSGDLIVRFSIGNEELFIPQDTRAKIVSSDILGSKSIQLIIGDSRDPIHSEDTMLSDIENTLTEQVNQQILPLKRKAEGLIQTVDSAIIAVSAIFNKGARDDLNASFASIKVSLQVFEETMVELEGMVSDERENIHRIFVHVESITQNLSNNNEQLSRTIKNFADISDTLAQANLKMVVDNANKAMLDLSEITAKINKGEGSLGMLMNNDTLYNNLEVAASDLSNLLIDMKLNPERYVHFSVFGRKESTSDKKEILEMEEER